MKARSSEKQASALLSTAPMWEAVRKIWKVKKRRDWDLCRSLPSLSEMETIGEGVGLG